MGRWVVGDNRVVIENTADGRISMDVTSRKALVGDWALFEDLAAKVLLALMDDAAGAEPSAAFRAYIAALDEGLGPVDPVVGAANPDLAAPTSRGHQPGGGG